MKAWKRIIALTTAVVLLANTGIDRGAAATSSDEPKQGTEIIQDETNPVIPVTISGNEMNAAGEPVSDDEAEPQEKITFTVTIPTKWTNTCSSWVKVSDGVSVYFKVSEEEVEDWGSYSDESAKLWNGGSGLPESGQDGSYIKFWAVKDEECLDETDGKYFYDTTAPGAFELKCAEEESGRFIKNVDIITDEISGMNSVYYSVGKSYSTAVDVKKKATLIEDAAETDNGLRFVIPISKDIWDKEVYVYAFDNAGNYRAESVYVNPLYTFEVSVPSGWTDTYSDWVKATGDITVYFKISDEDVWDEFNAEDAEIWSSNVSIEETGKDGAYIKFWGVRGGEPEENPGAKHFYLDMTAPKMFSLETVGNGSEEYYIQNKEAVSDDLSGVGGVYYSVSTKYDTVADLKDVDKAVSVTFDTDKEDNSVSFKIPYEDTMGGNTVYVYVVDNVGNIRSSSVFVAKHFLTFFKVNVTGEWTNSCDNWVEASEDLTVYFRTRYYQHTNLGNYDDAEASEWGKDGVNESNRYINFWFIKDGEVYESSKQYSYRLDTVAPNAFGLKIEDESLDYYKIVNDGDLSDTLSGIDKAFYTIGREYDPSADETKKNEIELTDNNKNFSIHCTEAMKGKTVYVYVLDKAGNMTYAACDVGEVVKTEAPSLSVTVNEEKEWFNDETLLTWTVTTDPKAVVYYAQANTEEEPEDWTEYFDQKKEWGKFDGLTDGVGYIRFWALYPDSQHREIAEATYALKYDNTDPDQFTGEVLVVPGIQGKTKASLKVTCYGIKDNLSGIKLDKIHYIVREQNGTIVRDNYVLMSEITEDKNDKNSFRFTIDLTGGEDIQSAQISVEVIDIAENEMTVYLPGVITFNQSIPVVSTKKGDFGIVREMDDSNVLKPYSYYAADNTTWRSVYVNGSEYLKLKITESKLKSIEVTINSKTNKTVTYSSSGGNSWNRESAPNEMNTYYYYLNVSAFTNQLDKKIPAWVSIEAIDDAGNTCPVPLIYEDVLDDYTLLYDPDDGFEPPIAHSDVPDYYGADAADQSIDIHFTDDAGLKNYTISVNGQVGASEDISVGKEDVPDGSTGEDAAEATESAPTDANKTERRVPYKEFTYKLDLDNDKYPFVANGKPVDGQYEVVVEVEDLAGNKEKLSFSFRIDTQAPEITEGYYRYETSPFNNTSLGLFGRESYRIGIRAFDPYAEDESAGIGIDSIVIDWDDQKIPGVYNERLSVYEFAALPAEHKGILIVTITDRIGNETSYAVVSADQVDENYNSMNVKLQFGDVESAIPVMIETNAPTAEIILPETFEAEEDTDETAEGGDRQNTEAGNDASAGTVEGEPAEGETSEGEPAEVDAEEEEIANHKDVLIIYDVTTEDGHTERWYPGSIIYQVSAQDQESGLRSVTVKQNDNVIAEENSCGDISFAQEIFNDTANYTYSVTEEGNYIITVSALDNALNDSTDVPAEGQSYIIHLDKTNPEITEFRFGEQSGEGESVEKTTYGFFFTEETEIRIYIRDAGISSGLNSVTLYLRDINGDTIKLVKNADEFEFDEEAFKADSEKASEQDKKDGKDDEDGKDEDDEEGEDAEDISEADPDAPSYLYASFIIEKGFKGGVTAIAVDNVGHSSGMIHAEGSIIENPEIHPDTSGIAIQANEQAKQKDANGIPLYNDSIPVTVTIEDTFSGIGRVDWSISKDRKAGTIEVDLEGNCRVVAGSATILTDSVERDQNLVTKLQFRILVESDANSNTVHVSFADRAGNKSEKEAVFSIDKTAPVITATLGTGTAKNGNFFSTGKTVTVMITERNFNPNNVSVKVNNATQAVNWGDRGASVTTDETVHTGTFTINDDGSYDFTVNYTDMAGNTGDTFMQPRFIIDKTSPKITNNFASFGNLDDEKIYFNIAQKDKAKAVITVIEANFKPEDMHVVVYYQPAGSTHVDKDAEWTEYGRNYAYWQDDGDRHTLEIELVEDGVFKIEMSPVDRAGNAADFGTYTKRTAVFEIDFTVPIIVGRNDKYAKSDEYTFYDLYDFERRNDDAPTIIFEDTNIDYIVCNGKKYTPVYENGREIGVISPVDISSRTNTVLPDSNGSRMAFVLDGFTQDGVYSVKLVAYDKAGNASVLNDSTYVRMVDPAVKVLAYIENSNREAATGWYSFEDENGPISKRPSSFSDLSIVVFSKYSNQTRISLVNKASQEAVDTGITDSKDALFDEEMYDVGAYRYILPGEYFVKNFTADADSGIYLRVENNGQSLDLGEMNIDNTTPNCTIPEHFHDWGWFSGSGDHIIEFNNISEALEIGETVAYVDGETIHLSSLAGSEDSPFEYFETEKKLTLTLKPGSHKVGLLLVDRAGNTKSIKEVQHLAVGNYRLWIGFGSGFGAILLAVLGVIVAKMLRKRRQQIV